LALTDGRGADIVVDLGGVGTLPHSYKAVGPRGEIALVGVMTLPEGDLSPYPLMFKGATLRGIFVGGQPDLRGLLKAMEVNRMKPVVDKVFAFDEAPQAFELMRSGGHSGKLVVRID